MRKRFQPLGVITDIPDEEIPDDKYTGAKNIRFDNLRAERIDGYTEVYATPLFPPKFTFQSVELGDIYWNYMGENQLAAVSVSTHTDLTPPGFVGSTVDGEWTGGLLNGLPVANNGANPPVWWDENPLNNYATLPDWPVGQTCVSLRPFKNHLFALGTRTGGDVFGSRYAWSDGADEGAIPQSWTPLPTTEAGDDQLSETRGAIIDGMVLRDQFIIYKRTSCYAVDYVAGNNVFSNRLLFAEVGLLARNCVAEVYGEHYIITAGDIVKHDGFKVTSIANDTIRKIIFDQIDPETYNTSFVTWNPFTQAVWFCFPSTGARFPNVALTYSTVENVWGIRDLDEESPCVRYGFIDEPEFRAYDEQTETYDESSQRYNQSLYSQAIERCVQLDYARTKMYAIDVGNTFDGRMVQGELRKWTMDLGDNTTVKTVSQIWPRAQGEADVEVRLGSQPHPREGVAWGPWVSFTIGEEKVDYFMTGRYISIEFQSSAQQTWQISGFDLEYQARGSW